MGAFRDLTGQVFGRLTVLMCAGRNKQGKATWVCSCACGNQTHPICSSSLVQGLTVSCGCNKIKHGHAPSTKSFSPTYYSWQNMIARCNQPSCPRWAYYGGATPPIVVCERWRKFKNFLEDMGERPEGTTLGRFGDVGNYEPTNCAWQTDAEQKVEAAKKRAA